MNEDCWRPERLVRLLGGRWTLAVLAVFVDGGRRYQELHNALDGISHKVLTETLRRAERDGLIARHLDPGRVETATLYELTDLGRSLGADELFVSLHRVARRFAESGDDDAVVEWQNATACSRRHLSPDGYGTYRRSGRHFGFFLEFDRSTMNRRDYFRKFSAYYEYATTRRFERDYFGFPTLLVITTSNAAEERIAGVARSVAIGRSVSLPLLLTCRWRIDDLNNPDGLLGRIWRTPDTDFDDRRFWLPVPRSTPYPQLCEQCRAPGNSITQRSLTGLL